MHLLRHSDLYCCPVFVLQSGRADPKNQKNLEKNLEKMPRKNEKNYDFRCAPQDHANISTSLGIEETNFKYIPTFKYLLSFVSYIET